MIVNGHHAIADARVADLAQAGKIRLAIFLPQYNNDAATGEIRGVGTGFVVTELARALAARIGVELKILGYPTPLKALEGLKARECDLDDAVQVEPVWSRSFPAKRENTGKFHGLRLRAGPVLSHFVQKFKGFAMVSLATEQGELGEETGKPRIVNRDWRQSKTLRPPRLIDTSLRVMGYIFSICRGGGQTPRAHRDGRGRTFRPSRIPHAEGRPLKALSYFVDQ